jgi:hypothetical protein
MGSCLQKKTAHQGTGGFDLTSSPGHKPGSTKGGRKKILQKP